MRLIPVIFAFLLLTLSLAHGQQQKLNGVYAGIQITPAVIIGGGMNRYDYAFYFRPDGTFNSQLEKPNWKTRVTGTYTISGSKLKLRYSISGTDDFTIESDGDIDGGGFMLLRLKEGNNVPKGTFEFSKLSSSGGGSSGQVFVGTSSSKDLTFDGKGNFSNNRSSATMVSGNSIGGGSSRNDSGSGTYKIKDGDLSLTYNNGKTEVHSFFYRPGELPIMAVIDGSIYFMKEERESSAKSGSTPGKNAAATNEAPSEDPRTSNLPDAKKLLLKANAAHGGSALDNIATVRMLATVQGMQVKSIMDVAGKRMRVEITQRGEVIQIEQLEGTTGWKWKKGKLNSLPALRKSEMASAFYSGIMGLRKPVISLFETGPPTETQTGYSLVCRLNGKKYVFIVDKDGNLLASGDNAGMALSTSVFSDLKKVDGVLLPFHEMITSGAQKLDVRYQKFDINPKLEEQDWAKPVAN